jgi:hypothetical protein
LDGEVSTSGDFAEDLCIIVGVPKAEMNTLPFSQRPTDSPRAPHKDDAMMEFNSEHDTRAYAPRQRRSYAWVGAVAVVGILTTAGVWAFRSTLTGHVATGSLRIESDPAGAAVDIDGSPRGITPLTLDLKAGSHAVTVTHGDSVERIQAMVAAGTVNTQHLHWAAESTAAAVGRLEVSSEPSGVSVSVDGEQRGASPLSLDSLTPGEHQVTVQIAGHTQKRTVVIEGGATASLVFTSAATGGESGWLAPRAAAQLQIFEGGRLLGNTDSERIMLPVGSHDIEFVGDALGFRAHRTVTITPGQTTNASMSLPQAAVNLNAVPWADVTIDGKDMGQTPIANLMLTIGTHLVTFRHPQFGDKQVNVTVSLKEPARVAVDMRGR